MQDDWPLGAIWLAFVCAVAIYRGMHADLSVPQWWWLSLSWPLPALLGVTLIAAACVAGLETPRWISVVTTFVFLVDFMLSVYLLPFSLTLILRPALRQRGIRLLCLDVLFLAVMWFVVQD